MSTSLDIGALSAAMLPRPLSPEEASRQRALFFTAIEPIQQMKLHLYSLYLPTMIFDGTGKLLSAAYPDEMQELIGKLDKMIEEIAASWSKP